MGCAESSEILPEEVAVELYRHMVSRNAEAFESLTRSALWHQGRQPDWEFIKRVFSVKITTTSGDWKETLVHYAVRFNELAFLQEMVQYDPDLSAKNSHGNNVVHTCCIAGASIEAFDLLTKDLPVAPETDTTASPLSPSSSRSVLDQANEDGDYPLHLASRNHFGWLVEALLRRNALRNVMNREGDTPLALVRNAHNRNPLSRGNVMVRKKTTKPWWDRHKMNLSYILALLDQGPAEAEVLLQQLIAQAQNLLEVGGGGDQRSSGSFEMTASGGGSTGDAATTTQGQGKVSPLAGAALVSGAPRRVSNSSVSRSQTSSGCFAANTSQGQFVKAIGTKRMLDVRASSGEVGGEGGDNGASYFGVGGVAK